MNLPRPAGELDIWSGELWAGVRRLLERSRDAEGIRVHRLQVPAARAWRSSGRDVPADFSDLERLAAAVQLAAPAVLRRVRDALDGPIVLQKGPEAAALYPDPTLRGFSDLDVIVPDAGAAQRALVRAGFVEIGAPDRYVDIHHLRPLEWPGLPLRVEVHSVPKWPERLPPPSFGELLDGSIASASGVDGVRAPSPEQHALLLAAHGWAHSPLRRVSDLLDVAAAADGIAAQDLREAAERWQLARLWSTTISAAEALFLGAPPPLPLRTWARGLPRLREQIVLEAHVESVLAGFYALPPRAALRGAARGLAGGLLPADEEPWSEKIKRTRAALRNLLRPTSSHREAIGSLADRPRRRNRR
jgi:hypothetical protein